MRGKILEVPSLLDSTLLWEPRQGVAGLGGWVETKTDGAAERATVQEFQG